jgi:hypothetical protein
MNRALLTICTLLSAALLTSGCNLRASRSLAVDKAKASKVTLPAPTFVSITPISPGTSLSPVVVGAVSNNTTDVDLFSDSNCFIPIGSGTKADFEGAGITALVAPNTSTSIYGMALGAGDKVSPCTLLTTYVHDCIGG